MNDADLLYSYMFAYRWGAPRLSITRPLMPLIDAATALMRAQLVGLRVIGTDTTSKSTRFGDFNYTRELLVVDVYTSVTADRPRTGCGRRAAVEHAALACAGTHGGSRWARLGRDFARRGRAPRRRMARSRALRRHERRLAALVETFEREADTGPSNCNRASRRRTARKRWAALAEFYKERGHFLVTNGPYRLKGWSEDSVTLEAFRDLSYPLGVGSYDAYAAPRRGFITRSSGRMSASGCSATSN